MGVWQKYKIIGDADKNKLVIWFVSIIVEYRTVTAKAGERNPYEPQKIMD